MKAGQGLDDKILSRSIDILKVYIGGEQKQDLQLESLYAIQLLSNELEHPSGKLYQCFFFNFFSRHFTNLFFKQKKIPVIRFSCSMFIKSISSFNQFWVDFRSLIHHFWIIKNSFHLFQVSCIKHFPNYSMRRWFLQTFLNNGSHRPVNRWAKVRFFL